MSDAQSELFDEIANELREVGYSIKTKALDAGMVERLRQNLQEVTASEFQPAGVGRGDEYLQSERIRSDEICWITGSTEVGREWLAWAAELQSYLNRRLFLGLFSFESHFAHYGPGDYYQRHYDAFRGETNRVLTIVVYLNAEWSGEQGGELMLYRGDEDQEGIAVLPEQGSVVVFLSEEFPHEVLPATCDRYSIAGWYRVNNTIAGRIDPPR